jgi:hypothetical protein
MPQVGIRRTWTTSLRRARLGSGRCAKPRTSTPGVQPGNRLLRTAAKAHRSDLRGRLGPEALRRAAVRGDRPKKQRSSSACRTGLRRWAGVSGKKKITWTKARRAHWKAGELDVTVSPELWLDVDGTSYVMKLYYKADKLTQHKVNLSLRLLEKTLGAY